ncbi:MAG: hypothetical protein KDC44_00300, partial [Phaeodactylibacter sp.]|nr:hypothetical protein [Phaeodactylibacter sp.]
MQFELLLLDTTACPACLWKIIGMFLAATLLGLILGWILWGRYRSAMKAAETERDNYKAKFTDMEKDHASLKYQLEEQTKAATSSKNSLRSCEADKATLNAQLSRLRRQLEEGDGDSPSTTSGTTVLGATGGGGRVKSQGTGYGAVFSSDNLQIVEGIGPKIETILKDAGIADWGRLAAAQPDQLRSTLEAAGPSYRIHDPESWPKQAQLAKDGKWQELIAFQKAASGGKENEGDGDTPSKAEKMYAKALGFSTAKSDDLK